MRSSGEDEETPLMKAKSSTPSPLVWILLAAVAFGGTAFYIKVSHLVHEPVSNLVHEKTVSRSDSSSRTHGRDVAGATSQDSITSSTPTSGPPVSCDGASLSRVLEPPAEIADRLRTAVRDVDDSFVLVTTSTHLSDHYLNFVAHAKKIETESGMFPTIISVNTDGPSQKTCSDVGWHGLKCFDASGWLPADLTSVPQDVTHFGTCSYKQLTLVKPAALKVVVSVLKPGFSVVLTDLDVAWYRNPLPALASEATAGNADFMCKSSDELHFGYEFLYSGSGAPFPSLDPTSGSWISKLFPPWPLSWLFPRSDDCNSGFIYATRSGLPVIEKWIEYANSEFAKSHMPTKTFSDQDSLNDLLGSGEVKYHVKLIDPLLVGHYGRFGTYVRHYNSCGDHSEKIALMKHHGDWLLDT
jgi:hypothetical protein